MNDLRTDDPRMGLGTDQLSLPRDLDLELPPAPRRRTRAASAAMPKAGSLDVLAPWAARMQLPGVDA